MSWSWALTVGARAGSPSRSLPGASAVGRLLRPGRTRPARAEIVCLGRELQLQAPALVKAVLAGACKKVRAIQAVPADALSAMNSALK
jgi:hypothetical protein